MKKQVRGDFVFLSILLVLILFGCVMVFSASYPEAISEKGNLYYFFKKHLISVGIGMVGFLVASFFPLKILKKMSIPLFIIAIFLMLLTKTSYGVELNDAKRWIAVGPSRKFTFMPAEFMKFSAILLSTVWLSRKKYLEDNFLNRVVPMVGIVVVSTGLIYSTEDLSSALTLAICLCGLLALSGLKLYEFASLSLLGAGTVYFAYHKIISGGSFRAKRLLYWKDPFLDARGYGWQTIQSYYAFSLGGILGVGLGQSKQKFTYIAEAFSDFIFAVIGEELGLVGCVFVLVLFMLFIWRGFKITLMQKERFNMLLGLGITLLVGIQALINISVTVGILPNTGIPLPFISYGGTSIMIFLGMSGLLFNLSKNLQKE
jgi:cell division protein FtsW